MRARDAGSPRPPGRRDSPCRRSARDGCARPRAAPPRPGTTLTSASPATAWWRICARALASSGPRWARMSVGTVTLPQSCSQPPRRASSTVSAGQPELDGDGGRERGDLRAVHRGHAAADRGRGRERLHDALEAVRAVERHERGRAARDARLVAAAALGRVERGVGAGEQLLGRVAVGRRPHGADRDRDRRPTSCSSIAIGVAETAARRRSTRRVELAARRRSRRAARRTPPRPSATSRRTGAWRPSSRRAISRSTTSPIWWPCVSLMRLKWSTSTSAIAAPAAEPGEARAQHLREVPAVEQLGQRIHAREPLEPAHGLGALVLGAALRRRCRSTAPVSSTRRRRAPRTAARSRTQRDHAVDADEAVLLLHDLAVALEHVGEAPGDVVARRDRRGGRSRRSRRAAPASPPRRPSSAARPGPRACTTNRSSGVRSPL